MDFDCNMVEDLDYRMEGSGLRIQQFTLKWCWREVAEEGDYLTLHCDHQNDFWIRMDSDESY